MLIHNATFTGSFSYNGVDISTITSSADTSASFATRVASLESTASVLTAASGTLDARVIKLESTASILVAASASLSTTSGSLNDASASLSTTSGSLNAGLVNVIARTGSFATTGSNVFYGNQTVSASMFVSGSITATGQIVAQTINVQSVTSSVVYSSGSNVFGNDVSNSQTFTGSMLVTGSVRVTGNICSTGTGCFSVVCSPTYVGGTFSGTTVYGSTAICGGTVSGTTGTFSSCVAVGTGMTIGTSGTNDIAWGTAGGIKLSRTNIGPEYALSQRWTGALAYIDIASSTQWNGGVTILPNGGGNVGIGTTSPCSLLDVTVGGAGARRFFVNYDDSLITIKGASNTTNPENLRLVGDNIIFNTGTAGSGTERMRFTGTGIACFSSNVCVGGTLIVNGATVEVNCSTTTNTDARINLYTSNNVNGDRATIYGYNLGATTGGNEITYLAFGYCSTNVQGYINMQTKSGASWCNTMSLRNGLVGIGTTTPGAKLEVNGAIIGTSVGIGGSPLTELYISSGTMRIDGTTPLIYLRGGSSGAKGAITLNHFGFTDFSINAGCSGNYILGITKTPGGTDGILLYCSGDVGIGISDPQSYSAKLTVAGNIRASVGCAIGVWDSSNTTYVQFSSPSSRNLRITNDAGTEYFRLSNPGIACFAGRVCAPTATIPTLTADQINLTNTVSQTPFGLSATSASTNQDVLSIGNERGVWLVSVQGFGGNNSYFAHSAIVYSAAYEKSFTDLGQTNHFGNSTTYFSLSTTSGASAAFRFCSNQSISGGTVFVLKLASQ